MVIKTPRLPKKSKGISILSGVILFFVLSGITVVGIKYYNDQLEIVKKPKEEK